MASWFNAVVAPFLLYTDKFFKKILKTKFMYKLIIVLFFNFIQIKSLAEGNLK